MTESADERIERIVSEFNDAANAGTPIRLHSVNGTDYQDIVPMVPENAFSGGSGQYYPFSSPTTLMSFAAAAYSRISKLPRVDNVKLVNSSGAVLDRAPKDLDGCFLEFDVRGVPRGDVYRVEVFPDATFGPAKMIEQIPAGTHVRPLQNFIVPLTRYATKEFNLAIYRVDAETARRDANISRPKEWEHDYLAQ